MTETARPLPPDADALHAELSHLVETLPLITFVLNAEVHALQYLSPQWYAFTGHNGGTADLNSLWEAAVHPLDQPHTIAGLLQRMAERPHFTQELRLRRHDGQYAWFLVRAEPVHDAAGKLLRWAGSLTDIDEQKQLQSRLERKDAELRRILHHLPLYLNTTEGPQHQFVYLSPGINELLQGRAVVGQSVAHCLPEMADQGFVHLLDGVYYSGEPFLATEQPLSLLNAGCQLEKRYFNFGCQLLPQLEDREGSRGVLCSWLDVTEQVLARQRTELLKVEVSAADARLRHLTEALPVITFITDGNGRTTYMSPQWYTYTGLPGGGPWTDVDEAWPTILHPDDRDVAAREIGLSITEGRLGRIELRLRRHDGQHRWHLTEAVPEFDARGRLVQRYGYMLDVHELREAQRRLDLQGQSY